MSNEKQKPTEKELNDLLDSALNDFETTDQIPDSVKQDVAHGGVGADAEKLWDDDFFAEQTKLLGERMNGIFGPSDQQPSADQMSLGLKKIAEAASLALQSEIPIDDSIDTYADSITEALRGLQDGVKNLQAPVSENDVASMFSGLGLGNNSDSEDNPFLPFMQGMMKSLLSAEILLPSINELLSKYPKYLEDNAEKLSEEDTERYKKQLALFQILRTDLESEKPDDSANVKQERFKRILENMQKLHEYGQPPEELIADVGSIGLPGLEAMTGAEKGGGLVSNNQCPPM